MKPSQSHASNQSVPDPGETLLHARIDALFRRLPMLCGFAVAEDLLLTDVAISTWPGYIAGADLYGEIADALAHRHPKRGDQHVQISEKLSDNRVPAIGADDVDGLCRETCA